MIQFLLDRNVNQILEDFEDVREVEGDYCLEDDEELIAFRMCVNRKFWDDELLVDYHFRVKRNGQWLEKCGFGSVRKIEEYDEEPWMISEDLIYWGPIAYFARKCA